MQNLRMRIVYRMEAGSQAIACPQLLELSLLSPQAGHFRRIHLPLSISLQTLLARLQEVLAPAVV